MSLSRGKQEDYDECELDVSNEMANRMSLFYADPTPMMKVLSTATTRFVSEVSPMSKEWESGWGLSVIVKLGTACSIPI